jgi:hypothetical protein
LLLPYSLAQSPPHEAIAAHIDWVQLFGVSTNWFGVGSLVIEFRQTVTNWARAQRHKAL